MVEGVGFEFFAGLGVGGDLGLCPGGGGGVGGVGGEDGLVELFVEVAQVGDGGVVCDAWVFQSVVEFGEAEVVGVHPVGAGIVEFFADGFEFGEGFAGIGFGEWEGFEAVGCGVAHRLSHRG